MSAVTATRAETIANRIRQAIRAGVYMSGDRLIELNLAAQLNVSQNTVREGLRLLEAEGWVVKHSRHGVYVRTFTRDEALELFALWETLEPLALRWAMSAASKKDFTQLRRLIQSAQRDLLVGEIEESTEAVFRFHAMVVEMCGRPQTQVLLGNLHNRLYLLEIIRQMRAPRSLHSEEARLLLYEKLISLMEVSHFDDAVDLLQYLIKGDSESLMAVLT